MEPRQILLVDHSVQEQRFTSKFLKNCFPRAEILTFYCVGDFLRKISDLTLNSECVVVTENFLPLIKGFREEDILREADELVYKYPWTTEWRSNEAGNRLARYLLGEFACGILFLTDTDRERIFYNLPPSDKLGYLSKDGFCEDIDSLERAIRSLAPTPR